MAEFINSYISYIESQIKYLKGGLGKEERLGRPFITISRETGAYGITIAEGLGAYLRKQESRKECPWTVFDKELLKKVAQEHGLQETVLPYLSESTISEMEDMMEEILGLHPPRYTLVHETSETILHLAQLGHAIIVGRGANIVTAKLSEGVHIRLVSPFEKRVRHMQEYLKIGKKEAEEYVVKEDRGRRNYVRKYFGKDIEDPLLYDLVINTGMLSTQDAVRVIGDLALEHV